MWCVVKGSVLGMNFKNYDCVDAGGAVNARMFSTYV